LFFSAGKLRNKSATSKVAAYKNINTCRISWVALSIEPISPGLSAIPILIWIFGEKFHLQLFQNILISRFCQETMTLFS